MENLSGYGAAFRVLASNTFPIGLEFNQFADDSDPLDIPAVQISDEAMGLNGDLVTWTTPNPWGPTTESPGGR